jgi:SPP1 gp7 family putative phage head morphogenesis protein
MPKAPKQLIDQSTRHQVYLEMLKTGEYKKLRAILEDVEDNLVGRLAKQNVTEWSRDRMQKQLYSLRSMMRQRFDEDMIPALNKSIRELAVYEAEFESRSLGKVVDYNFTLPSEDQIISAVRTRPLSVRGPDNGKLLTAFIRDWTESQVTRTTNTIRAGFVEGQTTPQIVRRLRDEVGPINRRGLQALTRTALQHCATQAREEVWRRNQDIVKRVQWFSTLDSRTTTQCQALDGQVFKIDEGPRPPIHVSCRSTVVAMLDERFSLLDEGGTRRTRDPVSGDVGSTKASETYYSWLRYQPKSVQDSIIGPTRGKLLREGGLSSQRFAELQLSKNYKPLTLDEMKKLEPVAFEKAGIE